MLSLSFDKMTPQKPLICLGILLFWIQNTQGCSRKNISCHDVKTTGGFNFTYTCPQGAEISVADDMQKQIAHRKLNDGSFNHSDEVTHIDNHVLITKECRNLEVKCIILIKGFVQETCEYHEVTVSATETPWITVIIVIIAIAAIAAIAWLIYCLWKKTLSNHDGDELNEVTTNGENRQSGSAENSDVEQGNTLHCIDPKAEGKTPQSHSLDHNFNNKEIQPSKNGDLSAPDINGACDHRAMHRNMWDDPGGVNDRSVRDVVGLTKRQNGWAPGDQSPEDPNSEGQPLLVTQRTAIHDFDEVSVDMTSEAAVLVHKLGFEQAPIRWCSIAPETDVESTSKHGDI